MFGKRIEGWLELTFDRCSNSKLLDYFILYENEQNLEALIADVKKNYNTRVCSLLPKLLKYDWKDMVDANEIKNYIEIFE